MKEDLERAKRSVRERDRDRERHKVITYIEYRAVSGIFRTIDPPPPFRPASVPFPRTKGGGVHSRRAVRGLGGRGGSIFGKTPEIGLASYSIIPLRREESGHQRKFIGANSLSPISLAIYLLSILYPTNYEPKLIWYCCSGHPPFRQIKNAPQLKK